MNLFLCVVLNKIEHAFVGTAAAAHFYGENWIEKKKPLKTKLIKCNVLLIKIISINLSMRHNFITVCMHLPVVYIIVSNSFIGPSKCAHNSPPPPLPSPPPLVLNFVFFSLIIGKNELIVLMQFMLWPDLLLKIPMA